MSEIEMISQERVFSGMGPTGRLHIGHYHGVLKNWVGLQALHSSYFMIADVAALTTLYDSVDSVRSSVWEMLIDWLAAGVDPEKATIFIQSQVPAQIEMAWFLGLSTPLSWLQDVPAYKEKLSRLGGKNLLTLGFLADPVMQAADILAYKATQIPVGADQVEHLHVVCDVARGFNSLYGRRSATGGEILPEPKSLLTEQSQLPGLDGEKMSKSYGNAIFLRSPTPVVTEKVRGMRVERMREEGELGSQIVCPVSRFHQVYSSPSVSNMIERECRTGRLKCGECKEPLVQAIVEEQQPMHERAEPYLAKPSLLKDIVDSGCARARKVAGATLKEVRELMGVDYDGDINPV